MIPVWKTMFQLWVTSNTIL